MTNRQQCVSFGFVCSERLPVNANPPSLLPPRRKMSDACDFWSRSFCWIPTTRVLKGGRKLKVDFPIVQSVEIDVVWNQIVRTICHQSVHQNKAAHFVYLLGGSRIHA